MSNCDKNYRELIEKLKRGDEVDSHAIADEIRSQLKVSLDSTRRKLILETVIRHTKGNKQLKILDYGCGGGQTVFYLRLLGFNAHGVCLGDLDTQNVLAKKLNFGEKIFKQYDGKILPYPDGEIDFIFSEQVLEHVMDIPVYYQESSRVLKNGGRAFYQFPHRLTPFDTHSRTWFIHYFPKDFQRVLYRAASIDPDYMDKLLNYKTVGYHRKVSKKYFSNFQNLAPQRLLETCHEDDPHYKGLSGARSAINRFIRLPVFGGLVARGASLMSTADILLEK